MSRTSLVLIILTIAALATSAQSPAVNASSAPAKDAAQAAALAWLSLVDRGDYATSWTEGGALLRCQIAQGHRASLVGNARSPLGGVLSRAPGESELRGALPGAPDGTYAVLRFQTVFANKASAIEAVILAREASG
jgi:hypothetical protein